MRRWWLSSLVVRLKLKRAYMCSSGSTINLTGMHITCHAGLAGSHLHRHRRQESLRGEKHLTSLPFIKTDYPAQPV